MNESIPSQRGPATVSLADEEGVKRILLDTIFGLWGTVNNLTRLRPSKRERYRVTIFGSARAQPGTWVYEEVKRLAGDLAELGCDIAQGYYISRPVPFEALAQWLASNSRQAQAAPSPPLTGEWPLAATPS